MVQEDLGGFGDARRRRVGARLLEAMGEQPTTCLHALAKDRNLLGGVNLFDGKVTCKGVAEAHGLEFHEPGAFGW